jgi:hypothetical protein
MKSREYFIRSVVLVVIAVLIVCCAKKPYRPKKDEPLYGVWVNENYNELSENAKYIYNPDGKGLGYEKTTDPEPKKISRFTIEEKWTDKEGNIYYKVLAKWTRPPYEELYATLWYVSVKIHPSGDVMEVVASKDKYYEEIKPDVTGWYMIHYRQ